MKKFPVIPVLVALAVLAGGIYWFVRAPEPAAPAKEPAAPAAPAPKAEGGAGARDLLDKGQFAKAKAALEQVPEAGRDRAWKRRMAEALDGLGERKAALDLVEDLVASSGEEEKPGLLWHRAQLLLDAGQKDRAEDDLYGLFLLHREHPAAAQAAQKLKTLWADWKGLDIQRQVRLNHVLTRILDAAVDEAVAQECLQTLEALNARIFQGTYEVKDLITIHKVKPGETLSSIAKSYGIYPDRIMRVNGMKRGDMLAAGKSLRIVHGHLRLVCRRDRFTLTAYLGDMFFRRYLVGTGKEGNTPKAATRIAGGMVHFPPWKDPKTGELLPNEDPRNPIGSRWIPLEIGQGFGIHGTREPDSVGKPSSNGCLRMRNPEVEELYDYLMKGDEVVIE